LAQASLAQIQIVVIGDDQLSSHQLFRRISVFLGAAPHLQEDGFQKPCDYGLGVAAGSPLWHQRAAIVAHQGEEDGDSMRR